MTRYKRAPLGSAILGGLFRDHLVSRAASVQPHTPKTECLILPPAHTIGRGRPLPVLRNQERGGGYKVCLQLGIHSRDTYN